MFKGFLKKIVFLVLISLAGWFLFKLLATPSKPASLDFSAKKSVILIDNGLAFESQTSAQKINDFLKEKNIILQEKDEVLPGKNEPLVSGQNIFIRRAVKIKITVDGKTTENYTLAASVRNAILENNITLGRLDQSVPDFNSLPVNNLKIVITRINVEEKIIPEDIAFKTQEKTDSKLSWRERKIEQKGEKGILAVKYKIIYKNGKEISRIILERKTTKEPVPEIAIQGTYMKLGKAAKGQGTWYAFKGGLFAASTTLPRGTYAKVTNTANGKTVVVQINDYGPQGKGRIIDLDKVAFAKIASLGAGVIGVKVEGILN
jgi:hypothetical protein